MIAVGNLKGGVGKSAVAVALVDHLRRAGRAVVLLDADPSRAAARHLARIDAAARIVTTEPTDDRRGAFLAAAREALADPAAIVVVDTPPADRETLRAVAALADVLVVPVGPSLEEALQARRTLEVAAGESMVRRTPLRVVVAPTRLDTRTTIAGEVADVVAQLKANHVAPTVRHRVAWSAAVADGCSVHSLGGPAADEATALARAILDQLPKSTK